MLGLWRRVEGKRSTSAVTAEWSTSENLADAPKFMRKFIRNCGRPRMDVRESSCPCLATPYNVRLTSLASGPHDASAGSSRNKRGNLTVTTIWQLVGGLVDDDESTAGLILKYSTRQPPALIRTSGSEPRLITSWHVHALFHPCFYNSISLSLEIHSLSDFWGNFTHRA